jgi:hypothetical protein
MTSNFFLDLFISNLANIFIVGILISILLIIFLQHNRKYYLVGETFLMLIDLALIFWFFSLDSDSSESMGFGMILIFPFFYILFIQMLISQIYHLLKIRKDMQKESIFKIRKYSLILSVLPLLSSFTPIYFLTVAIAGFYPLYYFGLTVYDLVREVRNTQ